MYGYFLTRIFLPFSKMFDKGIFEVVKNREVILSLRHERRGVFCKIGDQFVKIFRKVCEKCGFKLLNKFKRGSQDPAVFNRICTSRNQEEITLILFKTDGKHSNG